MGLELDETFLEDDDLTVITGISPGKVYTVATTRFNPIDIKDLKGARIRRSFLYQPYIKRHMYLTYATNKEEQSSSTFITARPTSRTNEGFHKAQQPTYDYGVKGILRLAERSEGKDGSKEVIFAIGFRSFNVKTGLPGASLGQEQ
ncbi:hypothetical protein BC939DRAFT_499678 [Gamsiella multidivaricata]|uniref:uncharacterized protein n=1 Tax=Gamsiella multidivaricata TaxID=101098 RepID=UPI0022212860|nr:uncharacterized protein BC939DRAFT_499678 [Gamsiella multidivaricata]KAI7830185.1 hypothetical protein BC939DRAFT_499678 [Gamsiella multidivaricata]